MKKKIIALVGRPNVGKSTLFNRLSINNKAIVHNQPGVTRDRKYAEARIGPFEFMVIDTPGLEESEDGKLEHRMMQQTIAALQEADITCLMLSSREQITPIDQFFVNFVRKYTNNSILIINKCEKQSNIDPEYYTLGFSTIVAISAEHAIGMMDLYEAIQHHITIQETKDPQKNHSEATIEDPLKSDTLQIVISGRPNAGKSTLINAIIGQERMLTGSEAGITRESIAIDWQYQDTKLKLIDTAGLRKRAVIKDNLEKLSASDAISSINFANTVILILDARNPLEQQDLKIASYVIEQGRGLIIAVNKWDLIKDKILFKEELHYQLAQSLPQAKGVPTVFISALNKQNIDLLLTECIKIYKLWNSKISTGKLNVWLNQATEKHQLPLVGNRRLRLKYMTQIKTRPPTFKIFANNPDQITDSYKKYLINDLREYCSLPGIPIRFVFTKTKNPYT
ncbi:ribosome biogenesis GTPase Der [Candidatus Trichorickettsia mobilis]|uniref:ribosome biogenesis GTPase Der n=1 Tax=Candidatus Trichorickettsia mobilis TaxID=1346319 RepID=UPI00292CA711|nr:ribosome biogenesis GTPase Der [Candidatus Trichorickettsia mobilis]